MSDRWETVGPIKKPRKPKPPTPVVGQGEWPATNGIPGMSPAPTNRGGKGPKQKKHSAKTPASFPLMDEEEPIPDTIHVGGGGDKKGPQAAKKSDALPKQKKKASGDGKPKEKRRDLQGTLAQLSTSDMLSFFRELQNAGSAPDVCLSWIKYSADALNTKLNQAQVIPPDVSQWPNDLNYPSLTTPMEQVMRTIISETVEETKGSLTDVLGISFASLLATMPTLVQRGDPGWGYLLFLRELCRVDPSLPLRKTRTITEIMESYGNRKEIGLCVLWSIAQAGIDSPYFLKIISSNLLPYFQFKHYKVFILAAVSTISTSSTMAVEYLIECDEFEEFFEAAFDPKKRRELEKIYPRVKELVFKGLKGQGRPIFLRFIEKAGDKDFMPLSAYGQEVFSILLGCLENDSACFDTWRDNLANYPKESAAFLSYLSKVPESVKCGNRLEKLVQTDQFAIAAVKNPELLRNAKKVQAGLDRVASSKRRIFSWKLAILVLILAMGGLFWLDVTENGKGTFEKSNTGQFLNKYGVLKEAVLVFNAVANTLKYIQEYGRMLFRSINEGLQPVLQSINKKVQEYIPQLSEYLSIVCNFVTESATKFMAYLQTNVFVGSLSPDNLRKLTKDALSFIWSNIVTAMENLYGIVRRYVG